MFWRKRKHSDFQEEVRAHLQLEADELREEGVRHSDAASAARREFGNVIASEERFYESGRFVWLEQTLKDLRYALRGMRRKPGFALTAILSLALGIGANTAVFSLIDAVVLKSLPVRDPQQLRVLNWLRPKNPPVNQHSGYFVTDASSGRLMSGSFSYPVFRAIGDSVPQFEGVVGYTRMQLTVTANGASEFADTQFVSGNYFTVLGVLPRIGRTILESDDTPSAPKVVILSYRAWDRIFGGNTSVIGRQILVNQRPVTVAGVLPPGFQGLLPGDAADLFLPMTMAADLSPRRFSLAKPDVWWVQTFGRLRAGASEQAAQAAAQAALAHVVESFAPKAGMPQVVLNEGGRGVGLLRNSVAKTLKILSAIVCLVLAIACLNLANLLLAQCLARQREVAVRLSIGASTSRLVRQFLTESLLLAAAGGVVGLAIAPPLLKLLLRFLGPQTLRLQATIDVRTLLFTAGVVLLAGILLGTLPAWRAVRMGPSGALSDRTSGARTSPRQPASRVLVCAQVALSVLLLVGAGLFLRTLMRLASVDLGFSPEHLLTFETDGSRSGYQGPRLIDLYARLQQNLAAIPGVESVAMSDVGLMKHSERDDLIYIPERKEQLKQPDALMMYMSASFLSTMRIPILLGRGPVPAEEHGAEKIAVVNQRFVQYFFPEGNPLGRLFYAGDGTPKPGEKPLRIIGVTKDAHYSGVRENQRPVVYTLYTGLDTLQGMTFAIRTASPPLAIADSVRQTVSQIDRSIPVAEMKTEEQQIAESIGTERIFAGLVSAFGAVAAMLAAIGLYGAMAYAVTQRTVEIGIRLALGANRSGVLWLVLRQSLLLVAIGLAVGIPSALALTGLVRTSLFGIQPDDPISFVAGAILMAVVGAFAAWLPARRAARVDPMIALRYE